MKIPGSTREKQPNFTNIFYIIFSTQWCESRPECKRLKLSDLLVKPMQRLTKYPLLLKAILKKTVDEDKRREITSMVRKISTKYCRNLADITRELFLNI